MFSGYYNVIGNWHKHPLVSKVMCKLGRHDYEADNNQLKAGYVYLKCFYCEQRKCSAVPKTVSANTYPIPLEKLFSERVKELLTEGKEIRKEIERDLRKMQSKESNTTIYLVVTTADGIEVQRAFRHKEEAENALLLSSDSGFIKPLELV